MYSLYLYFLILFSDFVHAANSSYIFVYGDLDRENTLSLEQAFANAVGFKSLHQFSSCEDRKCVESELGFLGAEYLIVVEINLRESVYIASADLYDGRQESIIQRASAEGYDSRSASESLFCDMAIEMPTLRLSRCSSGSEGAIATNVRVESEKRPKDKDIKERSEAGTITRDLTSFQPSVAFGSVPNNPMVQRRIFGVNVVYLRNKRFGISGDFMYSPDRGENDLKGLTSTLVQIAASSSSSNVEFQQPLEKMRYFSGVSAHFEFFDDVQKGLLFAKPFANVGLGLMSTELYNAKFDPSAPEGEAPTLLESDGRQMHFPINLGGGVTFWPSNGVGFKFRLQNLIYFAPGPQYDPTATVPPESRSYNNMIFTFEVVVG